MSSWIQRLCAALGIGIGSRIALVVEPSLADAFFPVKGLPIRAWDPDIIGSDPKRHPCPFSLSDYLENLLVIFYLGLRSTIK